MKVNLFYDGCIIAEIRDFRRRTDLIQQTNGNSLLELLSDSTTTTSTTTTTTSTTTRVTSPTSATRPDKNQSAIINYDVNFVLLQPSMQTLLADINSITNSDQYVWTQEDKYALESQLLLATAQPLCLDPSPLVSIVKNEINASKSLLNDQKLKKFAVRYSETYRNRSHRWHEYSLPYPFKILKIKKNNSRPSLSSPSSASDFINSHLDKLGKQPSSTNHLKLTNNNNTFNYQVFYVLSNVRISCVFFSVSFMKL